MIWVKAFDNRRMVDSKAHCHHSTKTPPHDMVPILTNYQYLIPPLTIPILSLFLSLSYKIPFLKETHCYCYYKFHLKKINQMLHGHNRINVMTLEGGDHKIEYALNQSMMLYQSLPQPINLLNCNPIKQFFSF